MLLTFVSSSPNLLPERSVAKSTLMRLQFKMNRVDMSFDAPFASEAGGAEAAFEIFDSFVKDFYMSF